MGVCERRCEKPDRHLTGLVPQERLDDARGELAHRQLPSTTMVIVDGTRSAVQASKQHIPRAQTLIDQSEPHANRPRPQTPTSAGTPLSS
jgi:hypothetical protein